MKKSLICLALVSLVAATSAEAGGWHGGHGGYHGHYHGGGSYFWWGAAVGAALTIPFYYASRSYAEPAPYYYYNSGPVVYANPPMYVQSQPVYVQSQPTYIAAAQPRNVVTQSPSNGVNELGPVNALPPVNSNAGQPQNATPGQAASDQWFVYPSRGQSQQQATNDRYECNRWATSESGYDPELRSHRNPDIGPVNYGRALSACLEGRGYTVR
jgi:hypothetical protein